MVTRGQLVGRRGGLCQRGVAFCGGWFAGVEDALPELGVGGVGGVLLLERRGAASIPEDVAGRGHCGRGGGGGKGEREVVEEVLGRWKRGGRDDKR